MSALPKVMIIGGPDVDARLELMRSLSNRFEMTAIGSSPSLAKKFSRQGFSYYLYSLDRGINPLGDLKTLFQLFSIIRKEKPHIVHTFDTKPSIWGRLMARVARVPVVIGTLPGLGSLYVNNDLKTRGLRFLYETIQRLASGISDLTIFQNEDDARQFIKARIVPIQKAMVILGSGINTNTFSRARIDDSVMDKLRTEFNIRADEIVVTMVSRIIRSKGVFEFMQSAREIKKLNPNVHFLLIGGEDRESIDRLTEEEMNELKQTVDWRGYRDDIPGILAITDIFVLPSIYREGIPRTLLEAAAMELPIITTDTPGCKDVVENGSNGYLIPPNNGDALTKAIMRLVETPGLRQSFGQASRQRAVHKFDLTVTFGQMKSAYENSFLLNQEKSLSSIAGYINNAKVRSRSFLSSGAYSFQAINDFWLNLFKRTFDISMSFIGLLMLAPIFLYVAARIKRDSPGPVFYRGLRMGKNRIPFKILKFRTMYEVKRSYAGPIITAQDDDRITQFGRWLRDSKINELPQLWNVLIGDMSLVGPRPEDVNIVDRWPSPAAEEILSVRPGITSPASILYHNEEKLLTSSNRMVQYFDSILPDKIRLDRLYIRYHSFFSDLDVIFWTLTVIIPRFTKTTISERRIFSGPFSIIIRDHVRWFTLDLLTSLIAVMIASVLWRISAPLDWGIPYLTLFGILMAYLFSGVNSIFGVNKVVWSKAQPEDAVGLVVSCCFATLTTLFLDYLMARYQWLPGPPIPALMVLTIGFLAGTGFLAIRYRIRLISVLAQSWLSWRKNRVNIGERVIIAGSGEGNQIASWLVRRQMFRNAFSLVGVVDHVDPTTYGMKVNGLWMLGSFNDLPALLKKYDIGVVLSTLPPNSSESEYLYNLTKVSSIRTILLKDLMWLVDQQVTQPLKKTEFPSWMDDQLDFKALHDTMTELPNRTLFQERLRHSFAVEKRNKTHHACIFVELNREQLASNDLDRNFLLKAVANRLRPIKREVDTLAHVDDYLFAFLIENVPDMTILNIVKKRISSALSSPFEIRGQEKRIDLNIYSNLCNGGCKSVENSNATNMNRCFTCVCKEQIFLDSEAIL